MFPVFKIFEKLFKVPSGSKCSECQSLLKDSECPNMDCPLKVACWIARWCSQAGLNILAIDLPLAKRLAKLHLVIHPGELYELSEGDWQRLDDVTGAVKKEAKRQLEESKNAEHTALLYGFRIDGVDADLAKRLVETFGRISRLRETKAEQLQAIEGVDECVAVAIRKWFRDSFNRKMLKILDRNGFRFD